MSYDIWKVFQVLSLCLDNHPHEESNTSVAQIVDRSNAMQDINQDDYHALSASF